MLMFSDHEWWELTWHLPGPGDGEEDGQHGPSQPVEVEPEHDEAGGGGGEGEEEQLEQGQHVTRVQQPEHLVRQDLVTGQR